MRGVGGGVGGPPFRDHLWQGPPLPVTLRLIHRDPLAVRKATLASLLRRAAAGLRFNEHLDHADGPLVFAHACKLGLEGIVSKRKDSGYRSGRSPHWIKSKNPAAPAMRREIEVDWSR